MTKIRKEFRIKDWKHCCGGFCKNCMIAVRYREEFKNKKEAQKKFKMDRKKIYKKLGLKD